MVELPERTNRVTKNEPGVRACKREPVVDTGKECLRKLANNQVANYSKTVQEAAVKYLMRECIKSRKMSVHALKVLADEADEDLEEDY